MKNSSGWISSRLKRVDESGDFKTDLAKIYAGSIHISELQHKHYLPLLRKWCKGRLLDCGSGNVPYYEVLKPLVSSHYCIDWSDDPHVIALLDEQIDLNENFTLQESGFDTVLLSDVIAHISNPGQLIKNVAAHLRHDGILILTTPFVYWMSSPPHEYFHPTEFALRKMCEQAQLEIVQLEPYGGYGDVLLDTLNKGMTGKFSNRVFRLLASVVKKTSWYKKKNENTKYSYPIGYTLVACKK